MFAAQLSGSRIDPMEDLDVSTSEDGRFIAPYLGRIKRWLLSHSQNLNFFTILVLASVSSTPGHFTFQSFSYLDTILLWNPNYFNYLIELDTSVFCSSGVFGY